ncbi:Uncharacterised protein [Citrobacter koseri]|nr:Uncharacterised protein [Citrobacter koseri]
MQITTTMPLVRALDFDGGEYGLGILSKYKIQHTQVINLPSGDAEQRVALLAQIEVPGFDTPVLVMVTHLDWQKDPTMRIEQVRHLLDVSIGDASSDFKDIAFFNKNSGWRFQLYP